MCLKQNMIWGIFEGFPSTKCGQFCLRYILYFIILYKYSSSVPVNHTCIQCSIYCIIFLWKYIIFPNEGEHEYKYTGSVVRREGWSISGSKCSIFLNSASSPQVAFKGTVPCDFRPQFFFINRIHLGHWPRDYNIFDFCLDLAEIFKFSEISRGSENQGESVFQT